MTSLADLVPCWPRLNALLDEALALPPAERPRWLDSLDGDSRALKDRLRRLLEASPGVETIDFLSTLPRLVPAPAAPDAPGAGEGAQVGPYRLLRVLGRGGMGSVWLAERADGQLKRQVALKLPHVGWSGGLQERLARERDILASLEHPNIARLYDAGIDAMGRPWLALEYVQGRAIDDYAREKALDVPARLALLLQVCAAVAYAHSRLVIHRDLKPSNILVTELGQVRLLDFGIAKLMEGDSTQATALTRWAGQALTPDYASPEQVRGEPLGTRSDVYSLGVVAYELLSGQRPYRLKRGTAAELEEAIAGVDPPRASDTVDAPGLRRQLRGDLDAILNKALKKSPAERFASVDAFSEDLQRHLRGHAVLAQPDSRSYRLRKFVVRHRWAVVGGLTFSATLLALSGVAVLQALEAQRQAVAARQEAQRAQSVQGFLIELFQANSNEQADPQAGKRLSARDLLDRGAARLDEALRDQPQSRFEVLRTLAEMYWQLDLRLHAAALERRRVELARQLYAKQDARLSKVLVDYTETIQETEHQHETPALIEEALATLDAAGEPTSEVRGQALLVLAEYLQKVSFQRAWSTADDAVRFLERHHPDSDRLIGAYLNASRMRIHGGDYDAAVVLARRSLEAAQRLGPERQSWLRQPIVTLGDAHYARLALDQAEVQMRAELALAERVMGEGESATLLSQARLGVLLQELGQTVEGDALHDAVRKAMRSDTASGQTKQLSQFPAGILGLRLLERGRPDQLEPLLRADIEMLRGTDANPPLRASRQRLWAQLQSALGRHDVARRELEASYALWTGFAGGANPTVVDGLYDVTRAQIETAAGNADAALALLDRVRPVGPRVELALALERARALLSLGRPGEAAEAATRALLALAALPAGHRPRAVEADAHLLKGRALQAQGSTEAAEQEVSRALELRRGHDLPGSRWLAEAEAVLETLRR